VRAYGSLTERGRVGRLRRLALAASTRYAFEPRRCVFAASSFNTIFRIDASDEGRYALRVGSAMRIHPEGTEAAEVAWMAALRRDGAVDVPAVVEASDGSNVLDVEVPGVPERRRCVAFAWMRGRPIEERLDAPGARRLGTLSAALHQHAVAHASSMPRDVAIGDRVLSWDTPSRLDELVPTYGSMVREALDRAQGSLDELWRDPPHPPHLVHGDLQPWNVIEDRDRAVVIDFQDLFWGFARQDLAITMNVIRSYPEPEPLLGAFIEGYRAIRPWPEMSPSELDALIAARRIQLLNLGLNVRKPGLEAFIAGHGAWIRSWMTVA
jgi:Ser/Thr protein kinase RdoA (MazF antagonist)